MNTSSSHALSSRLLDGSLLLLALLGVYFTFPVARQASELRQQRQAIEARVGYMPIKDPNRYHVLLLKSDNPQELKWRIYLPPKVSTILSVTHWSDGSGGSSQSHLLDEGGVGLITATFSPAEKGQGARLFVLHRLQDSTGRHGGSFNDQSMMQKINSGDLSGLNITGRDGVETFSPEEMVWLIKAGEYSPDLSSSRKQFFGIALGTKGAD